MLDNLNLDNDENIPGPDSDSADSKHADIEWMLYLKEKNNKLKLRQQRVEEDGYCHDQLAESESRLKVESLMEAVFSQIGGITLSDNLAVNGSINESIIDKHTLFGLRHEMTKLKSWGKLHEMDTDRLTKLVQLLEKIVENVVDEEGKLIQADLLTDDDISSESLRLSIQEKVICAMEAGAVMLLTMTARKMPKTLLIEDAIERTAQLCEQVLKHVIYPAADSIVRSSKPKKCKKKDELPLPEGHVSWVEHVYVRTVEMIDCLSELIRYQKLTEVFVVQLSTMAVDSIFVDNIGEIQVASIHLLSIVFRKYPDLRGGIMSDILTSIHRIYLWKNPKNCYRLTDSEFIHNFVVLVLQLIQSVVVMPFAEGNDGSGDDEKIVAGILEAKKWTLTFFRGFLQKHVDNAEEDFKKQFESFLQDLLTAVYRPEWPAAELMLTILGNLLVHSFRDKQQPMSLRTASLDYLGTIVAKLKQNVMTGGEFGSHEKDRVDTVVKKILWRNLDDPEKSLEDVDIHSLSSTDKMKQIQQALIDYLIATKSNNDVSVECAISFYAGQWYKETVEDMNIARERLKTKVAEGCGSKELQKENNRFRRITERVEDMKVFLVQLADRNFLNQRSLLLAKRNSFLMEADDAVWMVKFFALKTEFTEIFETYLQYILSAVMTEPSVSLRTKAVKCLTQIIEVDHEVLSMPGVQKAVSDRITDKNAVVREATLELLGKYLVSRPDVFDRYYSILIDRILDTGVAVRKRVIRIFKEFVGLNSDSEKIPEILFKVVCRISDEDAVKKRAVETLTSFWFSEIDWKSEEFTRKVVTLLDTVGCAVAEGRRHFVDVLFLTVLCRKNDVHTCVVSTATEQIVDKLVDFLLDPKTAELGSGNAKKIRLSTVFVVLSSISKARSEVLTKHVGLFTPYLSMDSTKATDHDVLNQVIQVIEKMAPVMEHPTDSFLNLLNDQLCAVVRTNPSIALVESAIACLGAVCNRFPQLKFKIENLFYQYIDFVSTIELAMKSDINEPIPSSQIPTLLRCLFSIGPMLRFINFGSISKRTAWSIHRDKEQKRQSINLVCSFLIFFSESKMPKVSRLAVASLGHVCVRYPRVFDVVKIQNMYNDWLESGDASDLQRKVQVLKNLHLFLAAEEERMIKAAENYTRLMDAGQLKDDLGAVDDRGCRNSAVIQLFWKNVLACFSHREEIVRTAMSAVVSSTMTQGLVTPGDSLSTLIAMTSDPVQIVRQRGENLIKQINVKYPGMLASKAVSGMRQAFKLQQVLRGNHLNKASVIRGVETGSVGDGRGFPKQSTNATAVLNVLYSCLRSNRRQRRSFLSNVVRMFGEDYTDPLAVNEMLFVADNLATFGYEVKDEPLFLIYAIDNVISCSGEAFFASFNELLRSSRQSEFEDEADDFYNFRELSERLPEDKTGIYKLMEKNQACFLLLYVKTYLKKLYRLSDAKMAAYSPSDVARNYERPVDRHRIPIFSPDLVLEELNPESDVSRNSSKSCLSLCKQICEFHDMYLSLDVNEEGSDENDASDSAEPAAKKQRIIADEDE